MGFIRGKIEESERMANVCLQLIFAAWAMNIGVSLFNTGRTVVEKIKKCRERRKRKIGNVYRLDKITDISVVQEKTIDDTVDMNNKRRLEID